MAVSQHSYTGENCVDTCHVSKGQTFNNYLSNSISKRPLILPRNQGHISYLSSVINSLAPGRFQFSLREVIFKLILVNGGWGISYEIALRWMPLDLTDDKPTLVQVMAWCPRASSHYLSQCCHRSMSPNDITRLQCVNLLCQQPILINSLSPGRHSSISSTCIKGWYLEHYHWNCTQMNTTGLHW